MFLRLPLYCLMFDLARIYLITPTSVVAIAGVITCNFLAPDLKNNCSFEMAKNSAIVCTRKL